MYETFPQSQEKESGWEFDILSCWVWARYKTFTGKIHWIEMQISSKDLYFIRILSLVIILFIPFLSQPSTSRPLTSRDVQIHSHHSPPPAYYRTHTGRGTVHTPIQEIPPGDFRYNRKLRILFFLQIVRFNLFKELSLCVKMYLTYIYHPNCL